jgi:transmembrane sensor
VALSSYCQFSADLEEQLPKLVTSGAVRMPATTTPASRWSWTFPRAMGVACAMAAAIIFGVLILRPSSQTENVVAALAERVSHTLADGTRVELNAHTTLRFENRKNERFARLAGGEAIFMVTKDPSRPFIVETPNGMVRVTGTTFNVRTEATAGVLEVTVVEGSVQVRPGAASNRAADGPFLLAAGDQLTAGPEGAAVKTLTTAALEDALAWRHGEIVFEDVPLRAAAERFAHYHGRRIVVDPSLANENIGGQYSLDDIDGFLRAMEIALDADLRNDANGTAFLSRRIKR